MTKYSEKTKLKAVEAYETGATSLRATAQAHGVGVDSLRKWIAAVRARGPDGVAPKMRRSYDVDFKLEVLRRVRADGLSYRHAAAIFDIRRFDQIADWARLYREHGPEGLLPGRKGMQAKMKKARLPDGAEVSGDDGRSREELLRDLQQLRMENAYLKKVQASVRVKTKSAPKKGR